jgi:hypothetical protein
MAKTVIYSAPDTIIMPSFSEFLKSGRFDNEGHKKAEEKYLADLKAFCLKRKKGKYIGETISFPVADGKAVYMVLSLRPAELMHVPIGDAWEYRHIHLLQKEDIIEEIEKAKRFEEIWKNAKARQEESKKG